MGTEFDPAEESKVISYLDANNLYGWAMSKQLPTSGFEWMTDDELYDWKHLSCFLEVDLVSGRFTRPSQGLSSCSGTR